MMVFGEETFRMQLDHEGGSFINGIRVLIRINMREIISLFLPHEEDTARRWPTAN